MRFFASLVLYTATASLRFRHAQRHSLEHDRCSSRTLVGPASKGKVNYGAAFYAAGPTHISPDRNTFGELYDTHWARMVDADDLVPDISVGPEGVTASSDVVKRAMRYPKFQSCLRSLAMPHPLPRSLGPRPRSALSPFTPFAASLRLLRVAFSSLARDEPSWAIGATLWQMGVAVGELLGSRCM